MRRRVKVQFELAWGMILAFGLGAIAVGLLMHMPCQVSW